MSDKRKLDIEGQPVELALPEDAVVTGAVVVVSYQRIGEDGSPMAGEMWGTSPITNSHAVGLARMGYKAIEGMAMGYMSTQD